jgi:hypothetical protein
LPEGQNPAGRRFTTVVDVGAVTASARNAHLYAIGMSGKGKSKLLEYCLYQDIAAAAADRGCGVIDPHSFVR